MWTKIKNVKLFVGVLYSPSRRFSSYPVEGDSFPKAIKNILRDSLATTTEFSKPELIQIDKYMRIKWH